MIYRIGIIWKCLVYWRWVLERALLDLSNILKVTCQEYPTPHGNPSRVSEQVLSVQHAKTQKKVTRWDSSTAPPGQKSLNCGVGVGNAIFRLIHYCDRSTSSPTRLWSFGPKGWLLVKIFNEHLLCARVCSTDWLNSSKQSIQSPFSS